MSGVSKSLIRRIKVNNAIQADASIQSQTAASAQTAVSASYALTASYALNGGGGGSGSIDTSSFVTTASFNAFTGSYNTGSFTGSFTGSLLGTASQALTASYTPNALITASVSSNILTFTKGNGTTFNLTVNTGSGGGSTSPGGSDTQIQYNSGSTFAGSSYFTYNYQSQSLQQGFSVSAIGVYSHAEGFNTQAVGQSSHTEGTGTVASGSYSHAEGYTTNATGIYSHAEGTSTIAAGLSSHAEGVLTSTYRTTPTVISSSENLYAYNTGSSLLVGSSGYTSTAQTTYVLWEDGDVNQVWISTINGIYNADPDGSGTRVIFSISEFDSQGPSTNVTAGGSVYDFETAANTWGSFPYNYGKFDYDNNLIEVYNVDLTLEAPPDGVLVTVPNSGSYAYDVSSITYSSNTSSITIGGTDQFGGPNNGAPDLFGAIITSGKVFLTNITGSTWSPEGSLINSLIGVDSYYNFTSKTFKLAGGIGLAIRPNTIAVINSNDQLLTGANFDGSYSYITTSAQLDPIYGVTNIPLIEFGNGSHTGGNNTVAYGNYQTVVGRYNTTSNYKDLFVVGGGDSNTRKDVLAVSTTDITMSGSVNISGSLLVNGSTPGGGNSVSRGFVIAMAAAM